MKRVARSTVVDKITNSNGRFFSVLFKKRKDGSLRLMTCRINKDGLETSLPKSLISVVDTKLNDYRNVNINGIIWAHIDGEIYKVK